MGSVTKIHRNLDYFERIVGHTIEGVGIYDGELIIVLDDGAEVCIFENETGLVMQINDLELDS